jgi:uncharacterized membrane protein
LLLDNGTKIAFLRIDYINNKIARKGNLMRNTKKLYAFFGVFLIMMFIDFVNVNGMETYQHPDESFQKNILNHIPINHITFYEDARPEIYLLLFWFYGMVIKYLLVTIGIIVFCFIFIVKSLIRLFHHGESEHISLKIAKAGF